MYNDATRAELRHDTLTFISATGVTVGTLTAKRGTLLVNKGTLTVSGNVIATGADNRRLETTRATFFVARNVLVGDTAYEMSGGLTPAKIKGSAFELDGKLTKPVVVKAVVPKVPVDKSKGAKAAAASAKSSIAPKNKDTTARAPSTNAPATKPPVSTPVKPAIKPPV